MTEARAAWFERLLPASPVVVYDEWLDPDALSDWMCPRPAQATIRLTRRSAAGSGSTLMKKESGSS